MLPPHWYQRDNTGSIPGTSGGWAPVQISVYLLVIVPTKKETEWRTCSWIRERHFLWREATSPFLKANYLHSSYFISSFKMGYSYLVIMILSFIQLPPALVNLYISPLYKLPIFFYCPPLVAAFLTAHTSSPSSGQGWRGVAPAPRADDISLNGSGAEKQMPRADGVSLTGGGTGVARAVSCKAPSLSQHPPPSSTRHGARHNSMTGRAPRCGKALLRQRDLGRSHHIQLPYCARRWKCI
jgi:hypothetical protein